MSDKIRTYMGFNLNNDHCMEINKKTGKVEINLMEIMALRLSGIPYTSSDSSLEKTVAIELGLAYNNMSFIRKSTEWGLAREDFVSINTLEDSQVSLLSGFTSQNGNSESAKPLTMTKGDAQGLGMKISGELDDDLRTLIIDTESKDEFLNVGIAGFVSAVADLNKSKEVRKAYELRLAREREQQARVAELQNTAIATLETLEIAEPTKEQILNMVSALMKAEDNS